MFNINFTNTITDLFRRCVTFIFQLSSIKIGENFIVHNSRAFLDIVVNGSLGLGESYMRGDWSSPDLVHFFELLGKSDAVKRISYWTSWIRWLHPYTWFRFTWLWLFGQSLDDAKVVGAQHYDLSPEMYQEMLGNPMQYSCAYWKDAGNLEQAQVNKMELLAQKLHLCENTTVLDIGCGWGDLAIHLAKKYQCKVVGLTISATQCEIAMDRARNAGVEEHVTFLLEDYRVHKGTYNRVVSVGMCEHLNIVGLLTYFQCVEKFLEPGGLAVIHSITCRDSSPFGDPWFSKYIFPNSAIPSYESWFTALKTTKLEPEHVQNIGPDYAPTLNAWRTRFNDKCSDKVSPTFNRMWSYYLSCSEAQFRNRDLNVWQIVLSKNRSWRYDLANRVD